MGHHRILWSRSCSPKNAEEYYFAPAHALRPWRPGWLDAGARALFDPRLHDLVDQIEVSLSIDGGSGRSAEHLLGAARSLGAQVAMQGNS